MPPRRKINLLPQDNFESSSIGKFLQWAVSVGRWIVVFTELIVICAFLSRFYFDTKLANLFDDIKQKKAIIASAANFEETFRNTQSKMKEIRTLLTGEIKPSVIITGISNLLPADVTLTSFSVEKSNLTLVGYSLSKTGLQSFWKNLTQHTQISNLSLNNISSRKEGLPGISFEVTAVIKK